MQAERTPGITNGSVAEYRFLSKLTQPITTDEVSPAPTDHDPTEGQVSYSHDGTVKMAVPIEGAE